MWKLSARLVVVLAILATLFGTAERVPGVRAAATLTVNPSSVNGSGQTITLSVADGTFAASTPVTIKFVDANNTTFLFGSSVSSTSTGGLPANTTVIVPSSASAGAGTFSVTDGTTMCFRHFDYQSGHHHATNPATPGSLVTVGGTNFTPNGTVFFYVGSLTSVVSSRLRGGWGGRDRQRHVCPSEPIRPAAGQSLCQGCTFDVTTTAFSISLTGGSSGVRPRCHR